MRPPLNRGVQLWLAAMGGVWLWLRALASGRWVLR